MRAELGLPSVRGDDEKGGGMMGGFGGSMGGVGAGKAKRPINVKFEIPYFTTSGIQVRYLKIIEPKVSACGSCSYRLIADVGTAAIPIIAMGALHHTVRRHCCAITGCELEAGPLGGEEENTNMLERDRLVCSESICIMTAFAKGSTVVHAFQTSNSLGSCRIHACTRCDAHVPSFPTSVS